MICIESNTVKQMTLDAAAKLDSKPASMVREYVVRVPYHA